MRSLLVLHTTRDWSLIDAEILNPERDEVVKLATCVQHTQLKAA